MLTLFSPNWKVEQLIRESDPTDRSTSLSLQWNAAWADLSVSFISRVESRHICLFMMFVFCGLHVWLWSITVYLRWNKRGCPKCKLALLGAKRSNMKTTWSWEKVPMHNSHVEVSVLQSNPFTFKFIKEINMPHFMKYFFIPLHIYMTLFCMQQFFINLSYVFLKYFAVQPFR